MTSLKQALWEAVIAAALIIMVLVLVSRISRAAGLGWESNSETNVTGYRVYIAQVPGAKTNKLQVINTGLTNSIRMPAMAPGRANYFQVTAKTADGESEPSNEIAFVYPLIEWTNGKTAMRLAFTQVARNLNLEYFLESSLDLTTWTRELSFQPTVAALPGGLERVEAQIEKQRPREFFRVTIEVK